jgi:hypothetical protein
MNTPPPGISRCRSSIVTKIAELRIKSVLIGGKKSEYQ